MSVQRTTVLCALGASFAFGAAGADSTTSTGKIYSCIGKSGKKITQDHPIAECADMDQLEHNRDGSFKRVVPRQETEEERGGREAKERVEEAKRVQRQVDERADRQLLARYPNKAAHDAARARELDATRRSIQKIDERRALLLAERKPWLDEAEFYVGKALPFKVKSGLDSNDAALAAQEELRQNQEAELARISKKFDDELERLRRLWAPPPGSRKANASAARHRRFRPDGAASRARRSHRASVARDWGVRSFQDRRLGDRVR